MLRVLGFRFRGLGVQCLRHGLQQPRLLMVGRSMGLNIMFHSCCFLTPEALNIGFRV